MTILSYPEDKFDEISKKLDLIYDELVRLRRILERSLDIGLKYEQYNVLPFRRDIKVVKAFGNELSEFVWLTIFFVIVSIFLMIFFIYIVPKILLSG